MTIQRANIFYRRFKKYFMGKSTAYLKQILFAAANISYIWWKILSLPNPKPLECNTKWFWNKKTNDITWMLIVTLFDRRLSLCCLIAYTYTIGQDWNFAGFCPLQKTTDLCISQMPFYCTRFDHQGKGTVLS